MRNLKKLFAIGLSTVMLMSSSIMAFAGNTDFSGDDGTPKTISDWQHVDPALFSTADVEIQKGSGTDSWKMTSGETGKATFKNTTKTTSLTVNFQDGSSLDGVTVNVYQLLNITGGDEINGYNYTLANESLRAFFMTYFGLGTADDASIIERLTSLKGETNAKLADFTNKLQKYITEESITAVGTHTGTTDESELTFDISRQYEYSYNGGDEKHVYSRGKGYYFVTRSDAIDNTYALALLDDDSNTLPLKGTKLTIEKTGDQVVMKVGDEVNYKLESKMINTKGDPTYKYIIYDRLEDTMSVKEGSFVVKVGEATLSEGTDYTLNLNDTVDIGTAGSSNIVPAISIKFKFDDASELKEDAHIGETVTVTYTATMTGTATSGNDTIQGFENYNEAWIEYGDDKTEKDKWDVYTLAMKIKKTNESGGVLAGAEFNLYPTADDPGTALNFAKNEEKGYYYLSETGTATLVTDASGFIDIRGLDKGIYKLVETKAPDGYQTVDPAVITVTVTENNLTDEFSNLKATIPAETTYAKITGANDADGYINLTIMDPTQGSSDLPATGGVGRIFIYVIGSLILIGGCAAFVITRKKSA